MVILTPHSLGGEKKTGLKCEGDVMFSSGNICHGHERKALEKVCMTVLQFKRSSLQS